MYAIQKLVHMTMNCVKTVSKIQSKSTVLYILQARISMVEMWTQAWNLCFVGYYRIHNRLWLIVGVV